MKVYLALKHCGDNVVGIYSTYKKVYEKCIEDSKEYDDEIKTNEDFIEKGYEIETYILDGGICFEG